MVKNDIELARDVINNKVDKRFLVNYFSQLYAFSNENLFGYLKEFDYKNKNVLTTGSSADQVFNLISLDCKEITLFDVNKFIKYYYDLKKAMILSLSRTDFLRFMCFSNCPFNSKKIFNSKQLHCIENNLSEDSKKFWYSLYQQCNYKLLRKNLFFEMDYTKKSIVKNNIYLKDDKNYYYLRNKFDNVKITFINSDLLNINLDIQYDYVLLSNILDYIFGFHVKNNDEVIEILPEYEVLLEKLSLLLKDDGKMFFHYFWNCGNNDIYILFCNYFKNNPNIFNLIFNNAKLFPNEDDSVFVYKKTH